MARLLIVDDEPDITAMLARYFTRAGYEVITALNGREALERVAQGPDMVLLDVMLPGADGFELMNMLAPMGVPVIFITARGSVEDKVKGLRLGADDYIVKPF